MAVLLIAVTELVIVSAVTAAFVWFFTSEARSIIAGAPFSPMPSGMVGPLLDMTQLRGDDVLVDLGCGDGRIMDAALTRGVGSAVGYEVAWWPLFLARRRLHRWGTRAVLVRRDARTAQLSSATVVYLYLFPKIVDILASRLAAELRPGTRVLSAAFPIDVGVHSGFRLLETRKVGTINAYLYERI